MDRLTNSESLDFDITFGQKIQTMYLTDSIDHLQPC